MRPEKTLRSTSVRMGGVNSDLKDDFNGSLRGEIIMLKSIHQAHFADKANPRNAASGVSKRLDGVDVDKLNILFYQVLGDVDFKTEVEQFKWLANSKLACRTTGPSRLLMKSTITGVIIKIPSVKSSTMTSTDWWFASMTSLSRCHGVIKTSDPWVRWHSNSTMRLVRAIIRDIIWQVGNSGRLTPVAIVDPVLW